MGDRSDIERVLAATDIVPVVQERVRLTQKGREWVGLCPFHDDSSPSMFVSPEKQIFKCFACGAGGDALTFVQRHDGLDFPQALEQLAERAGVPLERGRSRGGTDSQGADGRRAILEANAWAHRFFRATLEDKSLGELARQTIARRGISAEMVEAFALGAAPAAWDGLARAGSRAGLPMRALEAAQLVRPRDGGGSHYDLFRNRLIFPIHDQGGRVIAFGGRRLADEDTAKYLNSPETAVFHKSAVLYGLRQATPAIRQSGACIVTEGYTDTIACHQAGFTNTVATLGTAFTPDHARLLRRLCSTIVLLLDGDEAGLRAADRAAGVLFGLPLDVRIAILDPDAGAKDPDELLSQRDGRAAFERLVADAQDVLAFRFDRLASRLAGLDRVASINTIEEEIRWLADHGVRELDPLRREAVLGRLGALSGLDPHRLRELCVPSGGARHGRAEQAATPAPADAPRLTPADKLLGLVLFEPSALALLGEDDLIMLREAVAGGPSEAVAAAVDALAAEGEAVGMPALRATLPEVAFQWAVTLAACVQRDLCPQGLADQAGLGGATLHEVVAGLLLQLGRQAAALQTDPIERLRAARERLSRFPADPGRVARA